MSKSTKKDVNQGIRALLAKAGENKKSSTSKKKSPSTATAPLNEIEIRLIETNPFQPRTDFNEEELKELAASIKTFGLIQPITVRRLNARKYQIISGERRYRASQLAGLKRVPVYIREADDQGLLEMALLENIQRSDLNPVEVAISYQRLIDECSLTHDKLSERLGKSRSSITNHLRILKLAPSVQQALKEKAISLGHAKVLAGVSATEQQTLLLGSILSKGLSVRATEALIEVQSPKKSKNSEKRKPSSNPEMVRIIRDLSESIGTKVTVNRSPEGSGQIKINFASDREFNDIIDHLLDR